MPIPKPRPDENQVDFMDRCMSDETMVGEYPDDYQRYAVCRQQLDLTQDERIAAIRKNLMKIIKAERKF
jgi:hypothetical protein